MDESFPLHEVVTHRTPNIEDILEGPMGQDPANNPKMKALLDFIRNDMENPDPLTNYFHIPDHIPPIWQAFFEKVLKYGEKVCAANRNERVAWEKRGWIVEDAGLNEFDMVASARALKEKVIHVVKHRLFLRYSHLSQGNGEFRNGRFIEAFVSYTASIRAFPLVDAMLNLAQVALKIHRSVRVDVDF